MVRTPYWKAARVARLATTNWEAFDGACALAGVDPLALPAPRLVSAFIVWLRDQMPQTEEGKQQWRQLVVWMDTPPVAVAATLAEAPRRRSLPAGAPAGAPVDPRAQAAAFAASLGAKD